MANRIKNGLLFWLCLLLFAAGCSVAEKPEPANVPDEAPTALPSPVPEPTPVTVAGVAPENGVLRAVVRADDFALIERLPDLHTLDVSGSDCYDAILAYRNAHPDVEVLYTVPVGDVSIASGDTEAVVPDVPDPSLLAYLPALRALTVEQPISPHQAAGVLAALPDAELHYSVSLPGQTVPCDATALDCSDISPALASNVAEAIAVLPDVVDVELNRPDGSSDWTLKEAGVLQAVRPELRVDLTVTVFDRTFSLTDDIVSFNDIPLADRKDELLALLPQLRSVGRLDMENCGFSDEEMAALRAQFPSPKIAWLITLGAYSFRSDSKMLRLNTFNYLTMLTDDNVQQLTYCNEVKYLDLGHNLIQNPYFVASMPDLEVCIIAICQPTDLSAFASCPNLEYAELFNGHVTDVSPLANCKHLHHLNLCMNEITDITPLYGLDELERLWISRNPIPQEQIERFMELHPNCTVNTKTVDPTDPPWRYTPWTKSGMSERYALLYRQFAYGKQLIYSVTEPDKH